MQILPNLFGLVVQNVVCTCSNYEKLVLDKVPDVVRNCIQFLQSEAFFLILSNLTGLRLHRLAVTSPDSDEEEEGEQSSAAVSQGVDLCFPLGSLLHFSAQQWPTCFTDIITK